MRETSDAARSSKNGGALTLAGPAVCLSSEWSGRDASDLVWDLSGPSILTVVPQSL